jgi:signal transduction histidine kinase
VFTDPEEKSFILVIDNGPALRNHLDQMFNNDPNASFAESTEDLTYLINGCSTCADGLTILKEALENDTPYKMVFVESTLVDGSGLELISEFWQLDQDLHAVLCSADTELSWQHIVETLGESDQLLILQKPFSDLELRQIVHATMRKWQLGKQSQNVMQYMEQQINLRTQAIEEANKNLLQSEKLAAVGQLAAGIAHEINTPAQYVGDNIKAVSDFFGSITRLLSYYRQLLNEHGNRDWLQQINEQEHKEDLGFILEDAPLAIEQSLEGVAQIVRIVQAMKGFSHIGQGNISSININLALENTLLVARNSYKYLADIETQFGDLPTIECFPGELNQVFLNIIVNAAQAIEEAKKGRGKITIHTAATEEGLEIRISDTGCGIPEAARERVFDPFFTTKDVGKGTGQGLNIAYRIIQQQHGGTLSFTTETGIGTTFIILLNRQLPK